MQRLTDLDDKNVLHTSAKRKILEFTCDAKRILITRTAERDLSITPVKKLGVIDAIRHHIQARRPISIEQFDNGETAYVFKGMLD